jgi:hypothetical protein
MLIRVWRSAFGVWGFGAWRFGAWRSAGKKAIRRVVATAFEDDDEDEYEDDGFACGLA